RRHPRHEGRRAQLLPALRLASPEHLRPERPHRRRVRPPGPSGDALPRPPPPGRDAHPRRDRPRRLQPRSSGGDEIVTSPANKYSLASTSTRQPIGSGRCRPRALAPLVLATLLVVTAAAAGTARTATVTLHPASVSAGRAPDIVASTIGGGTFRLSALRGK